MRNKLCLGLIAVAFLFLGTAMAISFNAESRGSAGSTSFSGNYKLDDSTTLLSSINLDSGSIFKEMKAQGSGQNNLDESISTKEKSVQNTIISSGSMSASSSSYGSSEGVAVSHDANLAGDMGFIGTKSVSPTNEITIAGGFEGTGSLNERISSSSGEVASVGGTVSSAGVDLLNNEISQALSSGENGMNIGGVSKSEDGAIGKFSLVAVNQAKGASLPKSPTAVPVGPNEFTYSGLSSDPSNFKLSAEIMGDPDYLGSESSNVQLAGYIDSSLQLYLRNDANLAGEKLDPLMTGKSIATAAATWQHWTSEGLFNNNVIVSSNAAADKGDGYSVHAFKLISGSAIAYARTWTSRGIVRESDVCYNTRYSWTNDWETSNNVNARGQYLYADVQSIALHELGHATGLGDLYLLDPASAGYSDWSQIMNSYNGPQRYLGAGDIAGLQAKYGVTTS